MLAIEIRKNLKMALEHASEPTSFNLARGARLGTFDKFQGQEAPVVIYSMATSSIDDAPRGMDFLFSLNRLNVAASRAQGLAILLCSPELLKARCQTPDQMSLASALCLMVELAARATSAERNLRGS